MKTKFKKHRFACFTPMADRKFRTYIVFISTVCILIALTTGCSASPASATKTTADKTNEASPEKLNDTPSADNTDKAENTADTEKSQENTEGKWHILEPEVAAVVDADFEGVVWHIAEGAFSIAETKTQILEDGSLACSSPGSNANIPDSELVHVVVDDDTYFYIRTISGNGESYEDAEAGFGDLQEHMSVQLKGCFENDVFYASEIRMIKFS